MGNQHNEENALILRKYSRWLIGSAGYAESTTNVKLKDVVEFDRKLNGKDFRKLNEDIAVKYKELLRKREWKGKPIGLKTLNQKLKSINEFYTWLRLQPGYRVTVNEYAIGFLSLSKGERRAIKTQKNLKKIPTKKDILKLIDSIKGDTEVALRDKALISLISMTGLRVKAVTTLKLGDFDINMLRITLDPLHGAKTKASKAYRVGLIVFDKKLLDHVLSWIDYLKSVKNFTTNDPIFPMTDLKRLPGSFSYIATDIKAKAWKSPGAISKIFKDRSKEAGLEYYNPHSYRDTLYQLCKSLGLSVKQLSVISKNLGQNNLFIAEESYSGMEPDTILNEISEIDFTKPVHNKLELKVDSLDKKIDILLREVKNRPSKNDDSD